MDLHLASRQMIGEERAAVVVFWLRWLDSAILIATCLLGYAIRHFTFAMTEGHWAALIVAIFVFQVAAGGAGLYPKHRLGPLPSQIAAILLGLTVTFLVLFAVAYLGKISDDFSRTWAIVWFGGASGALALCRVVLRKSRRLVRGLRSRAVLLAPPGALAAFSAHLAADPNRGFDLVAELSPAVPPEQLLAHCLSPGVDRLFLGLPPAELPPALAQSLSRLPLRICLLLDPHLDQPIARPPEVIAGTIGIELYPPVMAGDGALIKRIEDVVLGSLLLVLGAPLLLLTALLVRLSGPGPVLFRQPRLGFRGEIFTIYKFRTMVVGASSEQATKGDQRVTAVGHWLRRLSLDELPQLLNVLKGDMSLVGPRPHALGHDQNFMETVDVYAQRRKLKPGMTGWAQISGCRGEIRSIYDLERRIAHDLYYLENWSLGFDLCILALTPIRVLIDRKAY